MWPFSTSSKKKEERMTHFGKKALPACSAPVAKNSPSIVDFCYVLHFHAIACLLLLLFCCPFDASAQKQPQLFTPVVGDKLLDATPVQTRLLEQIRSLPTTRSVHLVRINDNALNGDALMLSLPQVKDRALLKTGGERGDSKNFNLTAAPKVEQLGETTLVVRNGETTGSITSPRG